jgi:phage gp29-like protein
MNTNIKEYPKKSIAARTKAVDHYTTKTTLKDYDNAVTSAESKLHPNRYHLLEIYHDIIKESHLKSTMRDRRNRILQLDGEAVKSNGKKDIKGTKVFESTWFKKFVKYAIDAIFYGNSLIEISLKDGKPQIILVPRENTIPEFRMIKIHPYTIYGDFSYDVPAYKNLIDINNEDDSRDLGDLLEASKLVIFKNEVLLNWNQYLELFGQPLRVATSDSEDPTELSALEKAMNDMGRSAWMIKDSQTEIDFEQASGNTNSELYKTFIEHINKELSKLMLGATMLNEDGSSRSQSEVHERMSYNITKSDISFLESVIGDKLIPVLKKLGIVNQQVAGYRFLTPEELTVEEDNEQNNKDKSEE